MRILLLLVLLAAPAGGRTLIAAHTLRAQSLLGATDLSTIADTVPGALSDPHAAIGMETRVAIYAGRPILPGALAPPALVDRNQLVTLIYRQAGLSIVAEGRALSRAGVGEMVRVMNTLSHNMVTGRVAPDGTILVGGR